MAWVDFLGSMDVDLGLGICKQDKKREREREREREERATKIHVGGKMNSRSGIYRAQNLHSYAAA